MLPPPVTIYAGRNTAVTQRRESPPAWRRRCSFPSREKNQKRVQGGQAPLRIPRTTYVIIFCSFPVIRPVFCRLGPVYEAKPLTKGENKGPYRPNRLGSRKASREPTQSGRWGLSTRTLKETQKGIEADRETADQSNCATGAKTIPPVTAGQKQARGVRDGVSPGL